MVTARNPLMAEMSFEAAGAKQTILIDAPRRGEEPSPLADLYVVPSLAVAEPVRDKVFTTDVLLLRRCEPGLRLRDIVLGDVPHRWWSCGRENNAWQQHALR